MNEQNKQDKSIAPSILPGKRRRGRPRKDGGPAKRMILQTPVTPAPEMSQKDSTDGTMLGQIVSGVIDGCFDAGYFLSVNLGNSATTLRGLVFEPGRFSPITAANDIAPQVKMYHRSRVITLQDQEQQLNVSPGQVLPSEPMPSAALVPNNRHANPDQMLKIQSQLPLYWKTLEWLNKTSEGTSTGKGQNQPGSLVCSDLNSSNDEIHCNNVVNEDQKQVESEVEKDKSGLETLIQPRELAHCELKKLEVHRAPIDAQTQLIPTVNPELQQKDLSHDGQGNQDLQPHQTLPFLKLNSVAAESKVQPNEPIHNELKSSSFELHYVDMPQHNVTSDTQILPQQSLSESVDLTMERRKSPNVKEQQSTDDGPEVKVVGKEETSHEREQASDLSDDKLVLGSQCAAQQEDAGTEKFDYAANLETQNL
ncbi:hypothetical protein HAX54_009411 [Datura stramonium]|uniref:AT hook motif-containing protein n=1 Tax=Datura stramonium TaxID=4076 RepID=A0ABS8RY07_DATST|nr:hypothetical protein [Datura stramonium]